MLCKKWFKQALCILLAMILVFQLLPHQALADMLTQPQEAEAMQRLLPEQKEALDPSALEVVAEVPEKRTAFSKEFRMSNGLHMSAVYGTAVRTAAGKKSIIPCGLWCPPRAIFIPIR